MQHSLGVGLIGLGNVGGGVAKLLAEHARLYAERCGRSISLRRVLVRDVAKAARLNLVPGGALTHDAASFLATPDMQVVVEVAGGVEQAGELVRRALRAGKHVVTANKALLAAHGPELFALARQHGAAIAFEASCAGGIPLITATQFGLMANRIDGVYGILNGTCNYILTEMARHGKSYAAALREAQEKGFAEADPTLDVSGRDAAQKLAVFASLAFGARVREQDVWAEGIDKLSQQDIKFAKELSYEVKLLAIAERRRDDAQGRDQFSLRVHPCFVHEHSMIAQVAGPHNAVSVYGSASGHIMLYGRGAGQAPTASAVVGDVLNIAAGWYPLAFEKMRLWCDTSEPAAVVPADDLRSRFYLRFNVIDQPGVIAELTGILGQAGISINAVIQREIDAGRFVPLAITTHHARQGDLYEALRKIEKSKVNRGAPVCIRIVELPEA